MYLKVNMTSISVYLKSLWLYLKRNVNVKAILLLNLLLPVRQNKPETCRSLNAWFVLLSCKLQFNLLF